MNPFHIFASVSAMNCVSAMNPDNLKKEKSLGGDGNGGTIYGVSNSFYLYIIYLSYTYLFLFIWYIYLDLNKN